MFRNAYLLAAGYTRPIVIMHRRHTGECLSTIGACVVVNDGGWLITASHIVKQIQELDARTQKTAAILQQRADIQNDPLLNDREKRRRLGAFTVAKDGPVAYSVFFGVDPQPAIVRNWNLLEAVDLAVGKLDFFDPNSIKRYPKFCHPSNMLMGVSLCKLGFPFHSINPVFDASSQTFQLPPGALPMPLFPLEGMSTREAMAAPVPGAPTPYFPLKMLETSSPGLRGQSGGPIFDAEGNIWAIQTHTASLELGFSPTVKGSGVEHQFLNVGYGAHAETIIGLLSTLGVSYTLAS